MKSLVIYYSLLGHNKEIAENISKDMKYDILEFAPGTMLRCFQFFLRHKKLRKLAGKVDLSQYSSLIACGPIWGAKPAPAIKILLETVDLNDKSVKCIFTYTQDHGETEKFLHDLMKKKGVDSLDIQFRNLHSC